MTPLVVQPTGRRPSRCFGAFAKKSAGVILGRGLKGGRWGQGSQKPWRLEFLLTILPPEQEWKKLRRAAEGPEETPGGKLNFCVQSVQEVQNGAARATGWGPWFGPHEWLLHGSFRTKGPWRTAGSPFSLPTLSAPSGISLVGTRSFFHVYEPSLGRHGEMGLRRSWREVLTSQEASSRPPPLSLTLPPPPPTPVFSVSSCL